MRRRQQPRLLPLLLLLLLAPCLLLLPAASARESVHVAIVGAGIGGSASAYYIRQLLGDGDEGGDTVALTVFEREMRVGGRVENVTYNGTALEIGASILYSKNLHMVHAVDALGLHAGPPVWTNGSAGGGKAQAADGTSAIWDGARLVFRSSRFGLVTALRVLWAYRPLPMWRLRRLVRATLDQFMEIYDLQNATASCPVGFETPQALWQAVGLLDLTQVSLRAYLEAQGVGGPDSRIVKEFVGGVNRVNYNQNNDLNALAGLVSLCPTVTGEVVSVMEGNAAVAQAMLQAAQAELRPNVTVSAIHIVRPPGSSRSVYRLAGPEGEALGEFDAVVVAAPFALSGLEILPADHEQQPPPPYPPKEYQTTHATFIEGSARPEFFGAGGWRGVPGSVFAAENVTSPISSLALHVRVNATHGVYKVFSSTPLDDALLDAMFSSWAVLHHRPWQAYPRFHPPEEFVPFVLRSQERIYYVNALETAVSAMEISAIAATNVAILLARSFGRFADACGDAAVRAKRRVDESTRGDWEL